MASDNNDHINWEELIERMNADAEGKRVPLTEEEQELLNTFLTFRTHIAKDKLSFNALNALAKVNERISEEEKETKVVEIKRRRVWMYYAAAALLPIIIISVWFLNKPAESKVAPALAETAKQENVKLTLNNGQTIELVAGKKIKDASGTEIAETNTGTLAYENNASNEELQNVLEVPRGKKYQLTLSDGTKVWLNAESSLSYPVTFKGAKRDVILKGEGYFEVTHDASKPFTVHAGDANIQVLGTRFDVSSYQSEALSAILVEGKVRVSTSTGKEMILLPGQQAVKENGADELNKREVDAEEFIVWKSGMILYKNATLKSITDKLGRTYNYRFVFANEALKNVHCTLSLTETEDISVVLDHLAKAKILNYSIKGNEVYVSDVK